MSRNSKTKIPEDIQNRVYSRFISLPLKQKLVVYSKLVHGNAFKAQNNDLFGLNRRSVSKIFRTFIESLREDENAVKKITRQTAR